MRYLLYFLVFFIFNNITLFSQDFLKNGSFETLIKKKPKKLSEIQKTLGWFSGTSNFADLYSSDLKKGEASALFNPYGDEKPRTGTYMAGITAYSYRNKYPRTYLKTKLTTPLKEGEKYCVKFYVSLSDLSKYAVSHLGVHFTDSDVKTSKSKLMYVTHVKSVNDDIYEQQYNWTPICGVYEASGEENFMLIGNFTKDDVIKTKRVKRPRGYTKPQVYSAYYYIDDVSIMPVKDEKNCYCELQKGMMGVKVVKSTFEGKTAKAKVKYLATHESEKDEAKESNKQKIEAPVKAKKVETFNFNFLKNSFILNPFAKSTLDKVYKAFSSRPKGSAKIYLYGSYLPSEDAKKLLDIRRTAYAGKYLMTKGIAKNYINRKHFKTTPPTKYKSTTRPAVYIEVK